MSSRNDDLISIRPDISPSSIKDNMSADERFQNLILRPITVMQGDLIVEVFRNYIRKHKNLFYDLSLEKQINYVDNAISRDMKFRNSLKGMIIGQFTTEEYLLYIENSSALNKRMMHLVKEHLLNNIQLFDKAEIFTAI